MGFGVEFAIGIIRDYKGRLHGMRLGLNEDLRPQVFGSRVKISTLS